jgi:hypothetical protein
METTLIDDYVVVYTSNTSSPRIWLLNSGNYIGQLFFLPDGTPLQPDGLMAGEVTLYYQLEDFENCASLLRNEENVYLFYNGPGPTNENGLQTAETTPGT